ncbi:AI-2E family transporter [Acetobacter sp. DsW_059]|uniref:AI-2E family transporter n=1 Tax=Acetobacter sp. DsW_059 TaxID=1670661 RepID=UPI000A3BF65B|nr:AI-2E family transporter [Acetobacter sp. DsW_059]
MSDNKPGGAPTTRLQSCTFNKQSHRSKRGQEIARACLTLFIIVAALCTIQSFLPSLIWGSVFAIATWPLYTRVRSLCPQSLRSVILPLVFTIVIALIFIIPFLLITLKAVKEAQSALAWFEAARNSGIPFPQALSHLPYGEKYLAPWWHNHLSDPQNVADFAYSLNSKGMAVTKALGAQVAHRGTLFCFSILTLFFLYKDGNAVIHQCRIASRRAFGRRGEIIARQIVASVHGTVQGLVLVGMAEGAFMGVIYYLCGAPHSALFGVITAVAAMLPFCAAVAIGLVSLILLSKGAALAGVVTFCMGLLVIFVADHFVRPFLIGGTTKLHFLWVLLGILGGAETWGLLGLFAGPAVMAALDLVWRRWSMSSSRSKKHNYF